MTARHFAAIVFVLSLLAAGLAGIAAELIAIGRPSFAFVAGMLSVVGFVAALAIESSCASCARRPL